MPVEINGRTYYRTSEVCQIAGISKGTLFRWIKKGIVGEAEHSDRNGWRLFTEDELHSLTDQTRRVQKNHMAEMSKIPSILR